MRITDVEAIYVRMQDVKVQCDSGQDALIIRVQTDEGITGIGEVDSSPMAVHGIVHGPFSHTICCGLRELLIGEDPFQTEYLFQKMFRRADAHNLAVRLSHQVMIINTADAAFIKSHQRIRNFCCGAF